MLGSRKAMPCVGVSERVRDRDRGHGHAPRRRDHARGLSRPGGRDRGLSR